MKKILGYLAVFLVFSWVTTANATPIAASITNSNGDLTINGFSSLPTDGDGNPNTLNFSFDFTPGQSGLVSVFEKINIGTNYAVHVGFTIPALPIQNPPLPIPNPGPDFSAYFDIVSLFEFNTGAPFPTSVDNLLSGLIQQGNTDFTPQNAFLTALGDTMQLNTVKIGGVIGNPTLILGTTVIEGIKLIDYLNQIDGKLPPPADGSVTSPFTNAHAEVRVPEPTTLLLLGSGLLGMFGFYKKRA
jgi:hypothetical protein